MITLLSVYNVSCKDSLACIKVSPPIDKESLKIQLLFKKTVSLTDKIDANKVFPPTDSISLIYTLLFTYNILSIVVIPATDRKS